MVTEFINTTDASPHHELPKKMNPFQKGNTLNPLYTGGSSTVICWTSPFDILGMSDLFC